MNMEIARLFRRVKTRNQIKENHRILRAALIDEARARIESYRRIEQESPDAEQRLRAREKRIQSESELRRLLDAPDEHEDLLRALGI